MELLAVAPTPEHRSFEAMTLSVSRFALFMLPALAACGTPAEPDVACTDEGGPSVVAEIRDPHGRPAAIGATLILRDGTFADSAGPADGDELRKGAGNRRPGLYDVIVRKPGYDSTFLPGIVARGGLCGVTTPAVVRIQLELLADAPPIRAIVVLPDGIGFGLSGLTERMQAVVDADAGISTAVVWSSSDPDVASISADGTLTSGCGGLAVITARSVVDPSKEGRAYIEVFPWVLPCS